MILIAGTDVWPNHWAVVLGVVQLRVTVARPVWGTVLRGCYEVRGGVLDPPEPQSYCAEDPVSIVAIILVRGRKFPSHRLNILVNVDTDAWKANVKISENQKMMIDGRGANLPDVGKPTLLLGQN